MKIQVKGRHVAVTDALREHAEEKLARLHKFLQERHIDDVTRVELELWVEKNHSIANSQVAEATIFTRGPVIRARESSNDMYASIDLVTEKLERQAKKYRDKMQHRSLRHKAKAADMTTEEEAADEAAAAAAASSAAVTVAESGEGNGNGHALAEPRIVKSKRFILKPMSAEEAVLQLELVGHDFFVFTNAETSDTNVLYRRNDGDYGLIEPAS